MKRSFFWSSWLLALPVAMIPTMVDGADINYCEPETFADCTQASDCPVAANGTLTCQCPIADGDSVTAGQCIAPSEGKLQSRYPGVLAFGVCTSGSNQWADCLGVTCDLDSSRGSALCHCLAARSDALSSQQYVIVGVGQGGAQEACASDVSNSSATPAQVFDATATLREHRAERSPEIAVEATPDPTVSWVFAVNEAP
ncbi:MAG: hypothetical protein AAGN46_14445 [Acidobacteriota bacterium]